MLLSVSAPPIRLDFTAEMNLLEEINFFESDFRIPLATMSGFAEMYANPELIKSGKLESFVKCFCNECNKTNKKKWEKWIIKL